MSDTCDDNFQPFVNHILDSNISININGLAGTGKSTLIHQLQEEMDKRGLKYESLTPTNKAIPKQFLNLMPKKTLFSKRNFPT